MLAGSIAEGLRRYATAVDVHGEDVCRAILKGESGARVLMLCHFLARVTRR